MKINLEAYFRNIQKKTGKTTGDFKKLAEKAGFVVDGMLKPEVKPGEVIAWLKKDFGLGHGHALALYHSFKS